ncbi:hypothetical protein NDU88_002647 [Pleurodeles waltl]|uniref:Uncharacterized protein n=1 Tax=Pleurodeles waltl TaxID=8319 RepID=A0AAV7VBW3_PLEWA|nr:hypothetical protein NDU88_002647 [Pleurodeles waltl]
MYAVAQVFQQSSGRSGTGLCGCQNDRWIERVPLPRTAMPPALRPWSSQKCNNPVGFASLQPLIPPDFVDFTVSLKISNVIYCDSNKRLGNIGTLDDGTRLAS